MEKVHHIHEYEAKPKHPNRIIRALERFNNRLNRGIVAAYGGSISVREAVMADSVETQDTVSGEIDNVLLRIGTAADEEEK
jgi:hypothetical protein